MKLFLYLSDFIIPLVIFSILAYGLLKKVRVYDAFTEGARSGLLTAVKILPTLVGLMVAAGVLQASGFLDALSAWIGQFSGRIGFPGELVPLSLVKMFSSSAAASLLLNLYKEYGTDSFIGLAASICMSCTETIFYTTSLYFMSAKITRTRYTLPGALFATFAGLIASVILAGKM